MNTKTFSIKRWVITFTNHWGEREVATIMADNQTRAISALHGRAQEVLEIKQDTIRYVY